MSTLKTRVAEAIQAAYPERLTNGQLALWVGAPEPSVRRVTAQLEHAAIIDIYRGGYSNIPIEWQWRQPFDDAVRNAQAATV